jgi:hypothetical protein
MLPQIGFLVSFPQWLLMEMFILGVNFFAKFPSFAFELPSFPAWGVAVWWGVLMLFLISREKKEQGHVSRFIF